MKKIGIIFFTLSFFTPVFAKHITGGEVIYDYKGVGTLPNSKKYSITLRLFRDNLGGGAVMPPSVGVRIFNNDNNTQFGGDFGIGLDSQLPVIVVAKPPCLNNEPIFSYSMGLYIVEVDLPNNAAGYTFTYQTCCRVNDITNIGNGSSLQIGSTYTGEIPGTNTLGFLLNDNSARFETGISIICSGKPFILDFSATDPDAADQLKYEFYDAYNGGASSNSGFATPAPPPYGAVNYVSPYSGGNPFGTSVVINPNTGIITGTAPGTGQYIVAVNVKSYRNGVFIASHKKDFIVTVAPCDFASADIGNPSVRFNCDSLNTSFANGSTSSLNLTSDWDFGDPASGPLNISTLTSPDHQFSAPGNYLVKLTVNKGTPCASTDSVLVKVYPGFNAVVKPIPPQCKNSLIQFNDLTTTSFPPLTYWKWDFGVATLTNDTSRLQNPTYTYTLAGAYTASLTVASAVGCTKTVTQIVNIVDKPVFFITNDTLICTIDTLKLQTNVGTGTIAWSPNFVIDNVNSFTPLVSPDVTTTYTALYTDPSGCTATDDVKVSVVNEVSLLAANDTTICRTDTTRLFLNTDALYFNWTPTNVITDPTVQNPIIFPTAASTTFHVKASISNKCFKETDITVKTVPYPLATATTNAPICFGKDATLLATGGSIYAWSPALYLSNTTIANPFVQFPKKSITYTVTVSDTLGCPKPVLKTILVDVVKIIADAGPSDTSIVLGQPLNLQASGSVNYLWVPSTWLSDPTIFNPIANPLNNITYTVNVSNNFGCVATDTINVKVFFLPPDVYVPSAFSPNKDGNNDTFKPIPIGIKSLENFSVYNRWGEVMFTTSKIGQGWDGTFKGIKQDASTFVWVVAATDYKNKKIVRKGSVILIR